MNFFRNKWEKLLQYDDMLHEVRDARSQKGIIEKEFEKYISLCKFVYINELEFLKKIQKAKN